VNMGEENESAFHNVMIYGSEIGGMNIKII